MQKSDPLKDCLFEFRSGAALLSLFCLVLSFFLVQALPQQAQAQPEIAAKAGSVRPPVNALVPNFYYNDLDAARKFYIDKLGFPVLYDAGWVVIIEIDKGKQLALVDGKRGALSAVEQKGVLLVIETDALEEWYNYVSAIEGINWFQYGLNYREGVTLRHGLMDHGDIQEFRILDPEGYIIEFFRWKHPPGP